MVPGPLSSPKPPIVLPVKQEQARQQVKIDEKLVITFTDTEYDAEAGTTEFKGNVVATYGLTKIECASLTLNAEKKTGKAAQGVVVTDPEGTLRSSQFEFNWQEHTGSATDVSLVSQNVFVSADSIEVKPDKWELKGAEGALSNLDTSSAKFEAESVSITPGRGGVARRVYLRVFGARIGPLPRLAFSLRKRVKGLGLPSITNRKGKGVGVSWDSAFAIGDHAALGSFWEAFPKRQPGFGLQYSHSPLSPDATSMLTPQSDLDERYGNGWFDNISVRNPDEEHDDVRSPRQTFSVATSWNQGTTGRLVDSETVSKRFEVVSEAGGSLGTFGAFGDLRLQSLREDSSKSFVNRLMAEGTLLSPRVQIWENLNAQVRLDVFGTASQNGTFGWGRVEAGLIYQPSSSLTLGVGVGLGSGIGRPDFLFDGLVANRAFLARADFHTGPFTVRYLAKYDMTRSLWYDKEYELALVARQFEPYLVYRQYPSETRIGIRFRIDNLRDRLTRRKQGR